MNKTIEETTMQQTQTKNLCHWKCTCLIDVGYCSAKTGVDSGHFHVVNQLHTTLIRLPASLGASVNQAIIEQCKEIIEQRFFLRLAKSDCNYSVVGLKRWHPVVISISVVKVDQPADEVE